MTKRRLIGPMILSFVLCGLWADYFFFTDSPWSVVRFFSRVAAVFGAIFAPALNPELYGWTSDIAAPALMIVLALVLLMLSIARAKTAMNNATPSVDTPLPRVLPKPITATKTVILPQQAQATLLPNPRQPGLLAKFTIAFGVVSALFSVAVCLIAYRYLSDVTDMDVRNRADAMAMGISDVSAQQMAGGNIRELGAAVDKHGSIRAVAYVYVEDANGRIVAHMPNDLPRYLNRDFPRSAERAIHGTEVQYRGLDVYEIAKRIGGANAGFVHLGIWRTAINEETQLAITPIAAAVFAVLQGTIGIFVLIIRSLNRPLLQLVDHAGRISNGELVVPLDLTRKDEIGEIARSLERMRSSLRAVVRRLDQSQLTKQSGL
jgi:HAMP domain-containing protein